ncbi:molybdopterin oxidoreductase family protein [Neomoorella thermoacetica]|uniref:molybdopterin oxidoreductase family protein n=1 Tax=Neomoorella thermoacetica TaxID=1525 RepID=UPI0008FBA030|nr:molybdopterin oxidoreductase family protein [Moorella thermoacetica]OIQ61870.1 dimethyl sulfoxide reductase DmsA precursor [Moorella thermoacetica]
MTAYHSVCPFDCPDACGLLVEVNDGRITGVRGDPEHPYTRGFICAKMRYYGKLVHSPERILTPLKRSGPKGSGLFTPISWTEALETIAGRWQKIMAGYGSEAILPYSYAGVMGLLQRNAGHAFFHRLGATELQRTICSPAAEAGWQQVLGATWGNDPETIVASDLVIIWGMDPAATSIHFLSLAQQARKNGALIVVIDAYRTRTAALADEAILVRPGSDAALALGLMQVLVTEEMVDKDFLAAHVLGYEELRDKVLPLYTPDRVAALTGVPVATIVNLARAYGRARAPFIRIGYGFSRHRGGGMAVRIIASLPALVGAYGKHGGGALQSSGTGSAVRLEVVTRPDLRRKPVRALNMVQLGRALTGSLEPPVMSLYVYHGNPATVAPDQNRILAGLRREDLFTVVHERFLTDTALYADIILPATFSVEQEDLYRSYGHYYVQRSRAILPPPGEAKSNWQTFCLLARALGFEEDIFRRSEAEMVAALIKEVNLEAEDRKALAGGRPVKLKPVPGFATPSGKIELLPAGAGLPGYREPDDGHIDERYPFQLLTAPAHFALNSNFWQLEELRQREGGPWVLVNPGDCRRRGLVEGAWAQVANQRGSCLLRVKVSTDVPPGIAVVPGVWWCQHSPGGHNINSVIGDELTDLGGGSTFNDHRVDIRPL